MGPLHGLRVIEISALGPVPFAATLLGDLGAEVICVERAELVDASRHPSGVFDARSRRTVGIDLKHPAGRGCLLRMVERADALLEGFRPGVMERLGVGPDDCTAVNPRLVYGRMTGWGQDGPLASRAGHDITYTAVAGALAHLGRADAAPTPPLNLVGDYGGGALFLAVGVLAAMLEAARTGEGQVVDAAMVDGAAYLMGTFRGLEAIGHFDERRGTNRLDTGAPFYDTYATADGEHVAIGPLEPKFFREFVDRTGLDVSGLDEPPTREQWPELRRRIAALLATRSRAEWTALLEDTDACVAPVLRMSEATSHPHLIARGTFIKCGGTVQPAPAPRFSKSTPTPPRAPQLAGTDTLTVLHDLGFEPSEVDALLADGAVRQARPPAPDLTR